MSKRLVTFFSASGVTRGAASTLAGAIGADLYEITPKELYTEADLDWRNKDSRSMAECRDKSSRPELDDSVANIGDYDVIYVGFPIWCGMAPTIVNTFLEKYDFTGKTIVLFATSGGGGVGKSREYILNSLPEGTKVTEAKLLNGKLDPLELSAWADGVEQ